MKKRSGFTLVELLVAIAIFAVLSALGWKIFDYLIKTKERNQQHELQIFELQDAYQIILRDSLQLIPMTANINSQIRPALSLSDTSLQFSKAGVSDPLKEGLAPYERIEYRYVPSEKMVYRLKYRSLNITNNEQPESSVLLKNVDQFRITVLNPQILNQWPEAGADLSQPTSMQRLPRGLKIDVQRSDVNYEWICPLLDTHFMSVNGS